MSEARVPLKIWWQYLLGQIFYGPLLWWVTLGARLWGLKIQGHKSYRNFYKDLTSKDKPPLIICPNHLTYVDSVVLIYAFGNHFWYVSNFKKHMWNLVAKEYSKNPLFNFVCYLSKCIYLDREKERERNYPTIKAATSLLRNGEILLVFPEGRRSKTGRFDDSRLAYGLGKIIEELGECRVLCTYLRAPEQGNKASRFFPRGSNYKILTELVHYKSSDSGELKAAKIVRDISVRIKKLESNYFLNT